MGKDVKREKIAVTFHLDPVLKKQGKARADAERRTFSGWLAYAIEEKLARDVVAGSSPEPSRRRPRDVEA